jgi:hypothetical protein
VKCPVCGSLNFFVKDPDDEYETYDFELKGNSIVFKPEAGDSSPEVKADPKLRSNQKSPQAAMVCNHCTCGVFYSDLTLFHANPGTSCQMRLSPGTVLN